MLNHLNSTGAKNCFIATWSIIALFIMMQIVYIILCHTLTHEIQQSIALEQRILIRTVFYCVAIITMPLIRLIRHIFIRLNQTMPGHKSASQRYFLTVVISQTLASSIGLLGFIMFILGDDFNTLYIFSGLSFLGFFLYRPKHEEYQSIADALSHVH